MKILKILVLVVFSFSFVLAQNPSVEITLDSLTTVSVNSHFVPNENCAKYHFVLSKKGEMQVWSKQFNQSVDNLVVQWGLEQTEEYTHKYKDLIPGTDYVIFVKMFDTEGEGAPLDSIDFKTLTLGGEGVSELEIELSDIDTSSVRMTVTPNDQTAVFHDGLITVEFFDEVGIDSALTIIKTNPYLQYNVDDWVWIDLTPTTKYKAIAIGQNILGEWGKPTIKEFSTIGSVGIKEIEHCDATIYPQPNNGTFTIESEKTVGNTIYIFNLNGNKVHQEKMNQNRQMIDVSFLPKGKYFISLAAKGKSISKAIIIQ